MQLATYATSSASQRRATEATRTAAAAAAATTPRPSVSGVTFGLDGTEWGTERERDRVGHVLKARRAGDLRKECVDTQRETRERREEREEREQRAGRKEGRKEGSRKEGRGTCGPTAAGGGLSKSHYYALFVLQNV